MFEKVFKNIDNYIWNDAGCDNELDYAEQSSWMLFLKWFDDNKIEFINSIPKCDIDDDYEKSLFQKSSKGTFLSRFFSQLTMLFNELGSEGGLFIVIGKKKY